MENDEVVTVTKAREKLADIIGKVRYGHKRIRLTSNGKNVGAIVPFEDLELLEALEDRIDIELADRASKDGKTFTFDEILKEMGLTRQDLENPAPSHKANQER